MRRYVAMVLAAAAALALALVAARFVRLADARLATLPARVQAELARHGEPFVPLEAMAPALPQAAVAVEDRSFWTNPGISFEGVARAAVVDFASQAWVEGGSTITQQLVRDELLGYQKTVHRKVIEMAYALLAARMYPKATILALYLNEVDYGHGAFGVEAAARTYFGVAPAALTLDQSALLAGLPQDPAGLDPLLHPEAARDRRSEVLEAMAQAGDISPAQARAAEAAPLGLAAGG